MRDPFIAVPVVLTERDSAENCQKFVYTLQHTTNMAVFTLKTTRCPAVPPSIWDSGTAQKTAKNYNCPSYPNRFRAEKHGFRAVPLSPLRGTALWACPWVGKPPSHFWKVN